MMDLQVPRSGLVCSMFLTSTQGGLSNYILRLTELFYYYRNAWILLYRPRAIRNLTTSELERQTRARLAADSITRTAEDLLVAGELKFTQLHMYGPNSLSHHRLVLTLSSVPSLFGALSTHTLFICRGDSVRRQLAENKSRQCILALSELGKTWPVGMWIVKSFLSLMKRLIGQSPASGGPSLSVTSGLGSSQTPSSSSSLIASTEQPSIIQAEVRGELYAAHTRSGNMDVDGSTVGPESATNCDNSGSDPHQLQFPLDYFPGAADQLVHNSLWLDCLDGSFNHEFLQRELAEISSVLPNPGDGSEIWHR